MIKAKLRLMPYLFAQVSRPLSNHGNAGCYYIPAGKWTDLWTGEVVEGPKHVVEEDCPINRIPVFVRPGTVLLLGPEDVDVPDYAYGEVRLEARAYELQGETEVEVPSGRGPEIVGRVVLSAAGEVRDKGGMHRACGRGVLVKTDDTRGIRDVARDSWR
jgi:hypothetical protein